MHRALLILALWPTVASAERPKEAPPLAPILSALQVELSGGVTLSPQKREVADRAGSRLISLCPHCRLSTIDEEGPCGWARSQRQVIRAAVAKGYMEDEVVAAYVNVYGPQILAVEKNAPIRIAGWAVPYILTTLGLGLILLIGRALIRRSSETSPSPVKDDEARSILEHELAELD